MASEKYNGRNFSQLSSTEKATVNADLLAQKATFQVVANDQGLFRINAKTGAVHQIDPSAPGGSRLITPGITPTVSPTGSTQGNVAPSPATTPSVPTPTLSPNAPQPSATVTSTPVGSEVTTAPSDPNAALVPYEQMSPFAKSVSEPATERPFGAKPPTEAQSRAFGYGSRALQAHELTTSIEKRNPTVATGYNAWITRKLDELGEWSPLKLGAAASSLGGGAGAVTGITGSAASIAGLPVGNVIYTLGRGAALGAAKGAGIGAGVGLLGASTVIMAPVVAGWLRTEEEKQYMASKLDFMSSVLRKESGAAISVGEFISEDKRYYTQLNDPPSVIKQKELAREQAIIAFQNEAGRKLLPPRLNVPTPQTSSATPSPDPTTGMLRLSTAGIAAIPSLGDAARRQPQTSDEQALQESVGIPKTPSTNMPVPSSSSAPRAVSPGDISSRQILAGQSDSIIRDLVITNTPLTNKELRSLGIVGASRQAAVRIRAKALRDLDSAKKGAISVTLE